MKIMLSCEEAVDLKNKLARRIARWLNANGIDTKQNRSDFDMANEIMANPLEEFSDGDVVTRPSVNELIDGAESPR